MAAASPPRAQRPRHRHNPARPVAVGQGVQNSVEPRIRTRALRQFSSLKAFVGNFVANFIHGELFGIDRILDNVLDKVRRRNREFDLRKISGLIPALLRSEDKETRRHRRLILP